GDKGFQIGIEDIEDEFSTRVKVPADVVQRFQLVGKLSQVHKYPERSYNKVAAGIHPEINNTLKADSVPVFRRELCPEDFQHSRAYIYPVDISSVGKGFGQEAACTAS